MKPVLLIHGYSSEGKNEKVEDIYGTLPKDLRKTLGNRAVHEINLGRWISLSDGIRIDDVSFALDRALRAGFSDLLAGGFHAVVHSTGALVLRNWIKNHSPRPSPVENVIHLAGANFGSGLAHIGQGQLSRWGRLILQHTGRGHHILNELELGAWKTLDLQTYFLAPGNSMFHDYQVQDFCIVGSHIESPLRLLPIRYIKEDSSDNTVRTSACNLNFSYYRVAALPGAIRMSQRRLKQLVDLRLDNETIEDDNYALERVSPGLPHPDVPFAIPYKTSHFGEEAGVVSGKNNREEILSLLHTALKTPFGTESYATTAQAFAAHTHKTFRRVAQLKFRSKGWNRHFGYEGHSQLILRIRDQYGEGLNNYDVTFRSVKAGDRNRLETMIEDRHANREDDGTVTFYFRTQRFDQDSGSWRNQMDEIAPMHLEVTGAEINSGEIRFVPLNLRFSSRQMQELVTPFQTTVMDIEMIRLPAGSVFRITKT